MTIQDLMNLGWVRLTQKEYIDTMFDGELSLPEGDYLFHPCVTDGGLPIVDSEIGIFFYEDIVEPLMAMGLAWDMDGEVPANLALGHHPTVDTRDL